MQFNFRFERLLGIKKRKEEQLRREYFLHMNAYLAVMNDLVKLKRERDEAILRRKKMEREGARVPEFDVIENFLEGNKTLCIKKIEEIKENRKSLDVSKNEMLHASKERSLFDRLREKAFREYRLGKEAKEINDLDEIATLYSGRTG